MRLDSEIEVVRLVQAKHQKRFVAEKLRIANSLSRELRREHGSNLVAIGVSGSVARGSAEKFSDVDMTIILRKVIPESYQPRIVENTYCSLTFATRSTVIRDVTQPHPELPEKIGGYTRVLRLYDPEEFLKEIEARANHIPSFVFCKSAELALLHSYEDFCRVKNAYLNHDDIVLRDNTNDVTHSAALIVASVNETGFVSDREIFKAYKRSLKLPRGFERIEALRYDCLKRVKLFQTLVGFYIDLVDFCAKEGIRLPVGQETLQDLTS